MRLRFRSRPGNLFLSENAWRLDVSEARDNDRYGDRISGCSDLPRGNRTVPFYE